MTQWVLKQNGELVPQCTVRPLTAKQLAPGNEIEHHKWDTFDADISQTLGDSFALLVDGLKPIGGKCRESDFANFYSPTPSLVHDD